MSETAIATVEQPTRRQIGRRERSESAKVTGRLKRALDLMVWEPLTDSQAAVQTGMTLTAIRLAFQRPAVRAYLKEQREVLRARECGRNFHTLIEVRDQKRNAMARIKAVQAMEQTDDNVNAARGLMPGFAIQIINVQQPAPVAETAKTVLVSD